jgi:hypothetical protein
LPVRRRWTEEAEGLSFGFYACPLFRGVPDIRQQCLGGVDALLGAGLRVVHHGEQELSGSVNSPRRDSVLAGAGLAGGVVDSRVSQRLEQGEGAHEVGFADTLAARQQIGLLVAVGRQVQPGFADEHAAHAGVDEGGPAIVARQLAWRLAGQAAAQAGVRQIGQVTVLQAIEKARGFIGSDCFRQ